LEIETTTIEREIIGRIAAAKIRLRFDQAVLRLVNGLKAALAEIVPQDQTVIFTVTAPIRHPAKTTAAIESLVRAGLPDGEICNMIHGNQVRLRRIASVAAEMPRVIGFVHNPEADANLVLALAETQLRGTGSGAQS
jgi:hypothetical protein